MKTVFKKYFQFGFFIRLIIENFTNIFCSCLINIIVRSTDSDAEIFSYVFSYVLLVSLLIHLNIITKCVIDHNPSFALWSHVLPNGKAWRNERKQRLRHNVRHFLRRVPTRQPLESPLPHAVHNQTCGILFVSALSRRVPIIPSNAVHAPIILASNLSDRDQTFQGPILEQTWTHQWRICVPYLAFLPGVHGLSAECLSQIQHGVVHICYYLVANRY